MNSLPRPPVCPLPAWRQALEFNRCPLDFLQQCHDELGDVFCLRLPGLGHWAFLCSPESVRALFKAPREAVPAGSIHRKFVGFLFGEDALFNLDGEAHRQRQRLLIPLLSGKAAMDALAPLSAVAERTVASWKLDRRMLLLPETHRMSLDMLSLLIFGDHARDRVGRLGERFLHFTQLGARSKLVAFPKLQWNLGRFSPWGRVVHARTRVRRLIQAEIDAARRHPEAVAGTVLGTLIGATVEGRPLSDASLIDELMNLLFAGHETTGTVLAWAFEAVASSPEVREQLLEELYRELGDGPISAEGLSRLTYLDAVIQETLRFRPVGPFAAFRQVAQTLPLSVGDREYALRPGDLVAHCMPIMAMREDLFVDAKRFLPERFLEGDGSGGPGTRHWAPFGGGGRVCTGKGLAIVEMKVALATVLRRVHLELALPGTGIERSGHMLAPAKGLPMLARRLPRPMSVPRQVTGSTDVRVEETRRPAPNGKCPVGMNDQTA